MVKRVSLIAYVDPGVLARVKALSSSTGLSQSAAAGLLIVHGLDYADTWGLMPAVGGQVDRDE